MFDLPSGQTKGLLIWHLLLVILCYFGRRDTCYAIDEPNWPRFRPQITRVNSSFIGNMIIFWSPLTEWEGLVVRFNIRWLNEFQFIQSPCLVAFWILMAWHPIKYGSCLIFGESDWPLLWQFAPLPLIFCPQRTRPYSWKKGFTQIRGFMAAARRWSNNFPWQSCCWQLLFPMKESSFHSFFREQKICQVLATTFPFF